ncbi:MAG: nuclear transport factor 2 family protein [Pseudomonadota bacterium]
MTTQSPEEVVDALFDAFEARDFERVRSFLSDDAFSYLSPIESFSNADDYIANISRVGPILERIERCKTFVSGNDVCSILKIHTTMDMLNAMPVAELITVVDGKITSMQAIFDATEYNKMIVPPA